MKRTLSESDIKQEPHEEDSYTELINRPTIPAKAIRRLKLFESALKSTDSSGALKIPCPYVSLLNIGQVPPISVSVISSQSKLTFNNTIAAFGDVEDIFNTETQKSEHKDIIVTRRKFMNGNYKMHIIQTLSTDKRGQSQTLYSAILCREDVEPRKIHSLLIDSNYGEYGFRDSNFISRYEWKEFRVFGEYYDQDCSDEEEEYDDELSCDSSSCSSSQLSGESSDEELQHDTEDTDEESDSSDDNSRSTRYWKEFRAKLKIPCRCHLLKQMGPLPKRRKVSVKVTPKNSWRYWAALNEEQKEKEMFLAFLKSQAESNHPKRNRCKKIREEKQARIPLNNYLKSLEELSVDEMKSDLKQTLYEYFGRKEIVRESTLFIDSSKLREVGGCRFTIEKENEWVYCLKSDDEGGLLTEGNNGKPLGFILKVESSLPGDSPTNNLIIGDWHYGCVIEDSKSREHFAFVFGDAYDWYYNRSYSNAHDIINHKPRFDVSKTNYTYAMDRFLIDTPT